MHSIENSNDIVPIISIMPGKFVLKTPILLQWLAWDLSRFIIIIFIIVIISVVVMVIIIILLVVLIIIIVFIIIIIIIVIIIIIIIEYDKTWWDFVQIDMRNSGIQIHIQ